LKKVFEPPSDENMIRAAQDTIPCARADGKWILAATIIGSSMAFIDGTVVHVALPVLQAELNANVTGVQWIIEAYTLFLAALILVGGALGDLLGRRRIFASGWCPAVLRS
jgi:MFS family permease